MANRHDYLVRLQTAIQQLHNCGAHWLRSVIVHETFKGKTVWLGDVEVFGLTGHPQTKRCYAWSHRSGPNDERERFIVFLEIPPVVDAKTAVQASIVKDVKDGKAQRPD